MFPTFVLFGREISVYMVLATMGVLAAGFFACYAAKRKGKNVDDTIIFLLICALGAVIGSHLLYGVTNIRLIGAVIANPGVIDSIQTFFELLYLVFGGAVFYGGLLGGLFAGFVYTRRKKETVDSYGDIAAPAIPLLHTFGRIGCFLGGCCYGVESSFGVVYTHNPIEQANGVSRFPIQLVEALFNFMLFMVLSGFLKRGMFKDKLLYCYLLCYSAARFVIEFWRGDTYRGILWSLSTSQWISLGIFISVSLILFIKWKKGELSRSNTKQTPARAE